MQIKYFNEVWGWGLGIGDWGLGIGPNPQSPNPHSRLKKLIKLNIDNFLYILFFILLIQDDKKIKK